MGELSRRQIEDAIPLLKQASAALPDLALIRYHLGMSYLALGQDRNAFNEFRAALGKSPDELEGRTEDRTR